VFGNKRRREEEQALADAEARAEALAEADLQERKLLTLAIEQLTATLTTDNAQRTDVTAVTESALETLRRTATGQAAELAKAVEEIARMCSLVADRVEAEREERKAMIEAVGALAQRALTLGAGAGAPAPAEPARPRVVGGSIFTSRVPAPDADIVLVDNGAADEEHIANLQVRTSVRCRFGDQWIDGLEVAEIINRTDGEPRYRLRRETDRYVLPPLFEARDLQIVSDDAREPTNPRTRWTRS